MLRLSLPRREIWNEKTEEFDFIGGETVELEYSLYTVAAWEAKWKISFANKNGLTREQLLDYIMNFMCQTPDIPAMSWAMIDQEFITKIQEYMEDSQTATTFHRHENAGRVSKKNQIVTAELIYFYMAQFNIPLEFEHWHFNRLMTLIDVCAVKNSPPKKMSKREAAQAQRAQNEALRAKYGSRG